jgi:DNA-binding Lrp family transcriptional regulator
MAEIEMNIVRKQQNFTIIDNGIFKDKTLSAKAKGILTTMLSLPPNWNFSIAGITTLFSDSETSIRTGLQELEKAGYLKRERVYQNGKIIKWKYTLYEVKQVENLDVENQQVENLQLEARVQLSTNKLSNKQINKKDNTNVLSKNSTEDSFFGSAKQKPKKENLYSKCVSHINAFTENETIRKLLVTYLNVRLQSDKPLGEKQWKGILNKLAGLTDNEHEQLEIIQQSIDRGYLSFFPISRWQGRKRVDHNQGVEIRSDRYTEEELKEMEELNKERERLGLRTKF